MENSEKSSLGSRLVITEYADGTEVINLNDTKSFYPKENDIYTRAYIVLDVDDNVIATKTIDADGTSATLKKIENGIVIETLASTYDPETRIETVRELDAEGAEKNSGAILMKDYYNERGLYIKRLGYDQGLVYERWYYGGFDVIQRHCLDEHGRIYLYEDGNNQYLLRNADHDEDERIPEADFTSYPHLAKLTERACLMAVIEDDEGDEVLLYDHDGNMLYGQETTYNEKDELIELAIYIPDAIAPMENEGISFIFDMTKLEIVETNKVTPVAAQKMAISPVILEVFRNNEKIAAKKNLVQEYPRI